MITPQLFEQSSRDVVRAGYYERDVSFLGAEKRSFADGPIVFPERALAEGVLRQAAADLRRFRHAKDAIGREMHADARAWFMANNPEWPYSFANVCEVLGLSAETVLDDVLEDAESSWYSHSRRVVRGLARSVKLSAANFFGGREPQSLAPVRQ
jgi:hypothetical protein